MRYTTHHHIIVRFSVASWRWERKGQARSVRASYGGQENNDTPETRTHTQIITTIQTPLAACTETQLTHTLAFCSPRVVSLVVCVCPTNSLHTRLANTDGGDLDERRQRRCAVRSAPLALARQRTRSRAASLCPSVSLALHCLSLTPCVAPLPVGGAKLRTPNSHTTILDFRVI